MVIQGKIRTSLLSLIALFTFFLPLLESVSWIVGLAVGVTLLMTVIYQRRRVEVLIVVLLCLSLHAQWGLAEFAFQKDLNLRLLGETELSADKVGIAKFGDNKIIRAYGPYQHANSFGGVMVIALILWMLARSRIGSIRYCYPVVFFIILAVLVSFSRSALFSFLYLLFVMLFYIERPMRDFRIVIFAVITILAFSPFYLDRLSDPRDMGISERVSGYDWSLRIIKDNGLWNGVGHGSYKDALSDLLNESGIEYSAWQIDYVHSVPLLVASVIGLLPSIFFLCLLVVMLRQYVSNYKLGLLLTLLPLLFFDHYLLTQISPFIYLMLLITI